MSVNFSFKERLENINDFKSTEYDLLVIGGGIVGAGVARDAASRGMRVALVEAQDFASGTSSRSSKLIHGGIRYLENLEFGLVFEALSERRLLFEIAPHLVHPLRFILPLYKEGRVGMFKMGLGMWLYDALALFDMPKPHERLTAKETKHRLPMIKNDNLLGSYEYSDAYMDDDRLVIETLRSAASHGAQCANYVKATNVEMEAGKIHKVVCCDEETQEVFSIKAKHFVSTVGIWTDQLGELFFNRWRPLMRPSKGIHLTLDKQRLPIKEAVVMADDQKKRIVFGIPRHDMVIVGTTDTDYDGDLNEVYSTASDVEYLLKVMGEFFPGAHLEKEDVIASYAGIRPLVKDDSKSEGSTSREHLILSDHRNITFVTGGKYTTYRLIAEQTVNRVLDQFSLEEQFLFGKSKTKTPINSLISCESLAKSYAQVPVWAKETGLTEEEVQLLVDRHGFEAKNLLNMSENFSESHKSFTPWDLEVRFAMKNTMCFKLVDFYLRRSPLFLAMKDHGLQWMDGLADLFTMEYSWSEAQRKDEISRLQDHITKELRWKNSKS